MTSFIQDKSREENIPQILQRLENKKLQMFIRFVSIS